MKTGSKFPDLLTVRAEGTDHPPAPDRKRLTRQSKRKGKRSRSRGGRGQQQGQGPDDLQRMWCGKVNTLLSFAFFSVAIWFNDPLFQVLWQGMSEGWLEKGLVFLKNITGTVLLPLCCVTFINVMIWVSHLVKNCSKKHINHSITNILHDSLYLSWTGKCTFFWAEDTKSSSLTQSHHQMHKTQHSLANKFDSQRMKDRFGITNCDLRMLNP